MHFISCPISNRKQPPFVRQQKTTDYGGGAWHGDRSPAQKFRAFRDIQLSPDDKNRLFIPVMVDKVRH